VFLSTVAVFVVSALTKAPDPVVNLHFTELEKQLTS
jgi:hypothetical protein